MPKLESKCLECGHFSEMQPMYRRETINHSKKSKWIRMYGFFYCSHCGAISIDSDNYPTSKIIESEVNCIKQSGLGIQILLKKESEDRIKEKRDILKGIATF